ncbi:MAG: hypothetical protein WBW33_06385 [Bryobacteraceae bacterium]
MQSLILRRLSVIAILLTGTNVAPAQDVPPPPPPKKDSGPSLEDTLGFIRDKLNGQGRVSWMVTTHDQSKGQDVTSSWHYVVSDVTTNLAACAVSFNEVTNMNRFQFDYSWRFSFRDIEKLVVEPEKESQKRNLAETANKGGGPFTFVSEEPEVYSLTLYANGKKLHYHLSTKRNGVRLIEYESEASITDFIVRDDDMAQRMAKALNHAVELCGGGSKDAF